MEQNDTYQHIEIVSSDSMRNWSVGTRLSCDNRYTHAFPHRKIGELLRRDKTQIDVQDNVKYKRITIRSVGGGVDIRDKKLGKDIGTKKQYVIKAGQFVVSKIDARNGAFGVVPQLADGAIITGNFWAFDVDYRLIVPEYLSLLTSTKEFMQYAESASNGTTNRHYLDETSFLEQEIPLPSVREQSLIVESYDAKMQEAAHREYLAVIKRGELYQNILDKLGIKQEDSGLSNIDESQYKHLRFVDIKDVREWGYDSIIGANSSFIQSDKYPNCALGELVWINPLVDMKNLRAEDEISFIPMECISDDYGEWQERRVCIKSKSSGYTKFQDGDLIWAKITPCMQNGKSAIVTKMVNGVGCGSTEFHVLRGIDNRLNMRYLQAILRLPIVLNNAKKAFTGSSGQQRVPKTFLEKLVVPLPSMRVQEEIAEMVESVKYDQKNARQIAVAMRNDAKKQFEQIIFN